MLKKIFLAVSIFIATTDLRSQTIGCKDMQAINFDPEVKRGDGSCIYKETIVMAQLIYKLPSKLVESSGIVSVNGKIYTHQRRALGQAIMLHYLR